MRNLFRSVSAAAVLSLAASLTSPAAAGVKNMSLELTSGIFSGIRVVSEDGQKWSKLKNEDLQLNGHAAIEMGTGKILVWGIFARSCSGQQCVDGGSSNLQIYAEQPNGAKDVDKDISFAVPMSTFPVSDAGGIAVTPFGNQMVAKCNAHLANGGSIHKSHSFTQTIPMTLAVNTFTGRTAPSEVGPATVSQVDDQKTVDINIPVTCEAVLEKADQVAGKQPDFKVLNATLIGHPAIYRGSCPVDLLLSMKVESNIKGTFQARVEATNGGKSPFITLETSTVLPGQGTWTRSFSDKLTVPVKMLSGGGAPVGPGAGPGGIASPTNEDDVRPGGQSGALGDFSTGLAQNEHHGAVRLAVKNGAGFVYSDWWNYKVTCDPKKNPDVGTGPGGVSTKVDVTQAFIKVFPKATANGSQCGITVSGLVQTNVKNVNVTFRLRNHQGVLSGSQTLKTSKPGNVADLLTYFDFSKSGEGVWVDQSGKWSLPGTGGEQAGRYQGSVQMVGSNPSFTSNVATYDFTCKPRAPGGLKTPPKVSVNPDLPQRPGTVVVPDRPTHSRPQAGGKLTGYPKISCSGGKAKHGKCLCPSQLKPVHAGPNAWRCVATDRGSGINVNLPGTILTPRPSVPPRVKVAPVIKVAPATKVAPQRIPSSAHRLGRRIPNGR